MSQLHVESTTTRYISQVTVDSRKRKHIEDDTSSATADAAFQAYTLNTNDAYFFEPVSTLLRAHVPFSWLSLNAPERTSALQPGTLVTAHIDYVSTWDYRVLVARQIPNGGLYVIERVDADTYTAFPLRSFVTRDWIADASIGASPTPTLGNLLSRDVSLDAKIAVNHRRTPSLTFEQPVKVPKNRHGAAARQSILSAQSTPDLRCASFQSQDAISRPATPVATPTGDILTYAVPAEDVTTFERDTLTEEPAAIYTQQATRQPDVDMLSSTYLRQRYLEHLYVSKTSLAYYTKGPLSRARARARAPDSSMTSIQLADHYRDSILPAKKMDLKYRETLKTIVEASYTASDFQDTAKSSKPKRKSTKLSKTGLWSGEDDYILRWWKSRSSTSPGANLTVEAELQAAIYDLRMRETQMQIILMLETLSIEAKQETATKTNSADPDIKVESVETTNNDSAATPAKKKRNLTADIEMLADKLCIWHSIGLETSGSTVENDNKTGDAAQQVRDRLKDFCTDVLIPFYKAKLPELVKTLCKSLAGSALTQESQKPKPKSENAPALHPGSALRREPPTDLPRRLERILSQDIRAESPPVLARSATLPPVPQFKREVSEVSQRPGSRESVRKSVSFTNREIDLIADAKLTAAKRRKLDMVADQKRELEAAIQTLKKPNRNVVSKSYMDDIERRAPSSNLVPHPVQIMATPRKGHRTINSLDYIPNVDTFTEPQEPVVPASTTKGVSKLSFPISERSSAKKRAVLSAINDTPSKHGKKHSDPLHLGVHYNSQRSHDLGGEQLPTVSSPLSIFPESTSKHNLSVPSHENEIPVSATKAMARAMGISDANNSSSIYDELGWNEDYDD